MVGARDVEQTEATLAPWFAARLGADDAVVRLTSKPEGTGYSSETLMMDVTWRDDDGEHTAPFVLRAGPADPEWWVFEDYEIPLQFRVQEAVARHTDEVPIAPLRFLEEDPSVFGVPFYVMDRVEGRVPTDAPPYTIEGWLLDLTAAEQARLWWNGLRVLGAIARIDHRAAGLGWLESRPRWPGRLGVDAQVGYLERYYAWAARHGYRVPVVEQGLEYLREHQPDDDHLIGLSWGDARISNMIWDGDLEVAAVLDWEMVSIANPELDLAWWTYFQRFASTAIGVPDLPGFPPQEDTIAFWEEQVGRKAEHVHYYQVFSGVHFGIILLRINEIQQRFGEAPPPEEFGRSNPCTWLLADLLGVDRPT